MFDGLVFFVPIGLTKPKKEIFHYILDKYSLNPEETVFIDDNEKNITEAKRLGINGCVFKGNIVELIDLLKQLF